MTPFALNEAQDIQLYYQGFFLLYSVSMVIVYSGFGYHSTVIYHNVSIHYWINLIFFGYFVGCSMGYKLDLYSV